ncbi:NlpC/P60 family protein [Bacillus oleivorans]|uniref:NlpC/P60 family protein n=1 Tax=Bacillus oleivorans TaxID=1448271 RepID=A0A285D574_9BACI|nr:C40 family peptidase [Bacillus oleivorans]SNX74919.1 NlpC/P60 family protein [Bacillus oleivorans]
MKTESIIETGLKYLDTPYLFNSPPFQSSTFDCSSFVQFIFFKNGIGLPRNSRQQFQAGKTIPLNHVKRGDLLFFTTKKRKKKKGIEKIGHVALYLGNGQILHTYRKAGKVEVSSLEPYWKKVLVGARRVI